MDENNIYKIYRLKNYKITKDKYDDVCFSGTIDEIVEELKHNKGYHIRIDPEKPCLAFGDFDHTTKERFKEFLDILCDDFDCKLEDISITKSKKDNEYSYHWVIPSIKTTISFLKQRFSSNDKYNKFKGKEKKEKELDISVYMVRPFRLPNQTNKEKPIVHKIIRGDMKDFIIEHTKDHKFSIKEEEEEDEEEEEEEEEDKKEEEEEEEQEEEDIDPEYIEALLDELDADISRPDWLSVGMVLKNISDFDVWNEWISKGSKYDGKSKLKSIWDGLQKTNVNKLNKLKSLVKEYNIEGYNRVKDSFLPDFIDNDEEDQQVLVNNDEEDQQVVVKQKKNQEHTHKFNKLFMKSLSGYESDIALYILETYMKDKDVIDKYGHITSVYKYVCMSTEGPEKNLFYYYKNGRWIEDKSSLTIFKFVTENYVNELIAFQQTIKEGKKEIQKIIGKIKGKITGYKGIVEWLAHRLCNPLFYDLCDENIYLLNFDNGVYDTKTKTFRKGEPTDMITKSVGFDFPVEDQGYREEIDNFLKKVYPDPEVRKYAVMQQALALTGQKMTNDLFFTHTGKGSNGKSILQEILKNVFGDYFCMIPQSILTTVNKNDANSPNPFYSQIKGVRYLCGNEPSDGAKANDSFIKLCAAKEMIKYRTLFSKKVEDLYFQCSLNIFCNNKLEIKSTDGGMCRRIKVIEYVSIFTEKEHIINEENNIYAADFQLMSKVKEWKSDYMKMLLEIYDPKYIYSEPLNVSEASTEYIDDNNDVKKFVNDKYVFTNNKDDFILFSNIHRDYQSEKIYDQSKAKDKKKFMELIEKEMNKKFDGVKNAIKVKYGSELVSKRNVMKGWKEISDDDDDNSDEENNDI